MLKKDDPTKQLVYYQVIPFNPILRRIRVLMSYLSGRNRHLHKRCHPDAVRYGHVQNIGRDDCLEPPRPH